VWLTGNSGAGKTTIATGMEEYFNNKDTESPLARRIVNLDGDEMRATVSQDEGFSPEDRRRHNLRVARLANLLSEKGFLVLVSVIAPFDTVRAELQELCDPLWIYVKRDGLGAPDRPYEPPENPALKIDNDITSIEEARELVKNFLLSDKVAAQKEEVVGVA
ncbi:MAG: adenylyl-sulfate kinase, partial [Candidatus Peribacteraceae bacterium]|nr:adenylyl-sulfate kinase [Candidatus Peribacteraceae bacterium]